MVSSVRVGSLARSSGDARNYAYQTRERNLKANVKLTYLFLSIECCARFSEDPM